MNNPLIIWTKHEKNNDFTDPPLKFLYKKTGFMSREGGVHRDIRLQTCFNQRDNLNCNQKSKN